MSRLFFHEHKFLNLNEKRQDYYNLGIRKYGKKYCVQTIHVKKIYDGGGYQTRTVRSVNQRPVPLSHAKEFLARVNKGYEAFAACSSSARHITRHRHDVMSRPGGPTGP